MLADCHIHMVLDGGWWKDALARHAQTPDRELVRNTLKAYRESGFDFLRDGGDRWGVGELAAQLAEEEKITYRTPCFPIYKEGHYGSFIGRGYETPQQFRALVREVKSRGGHFIKIMISGLMDFHSYGVLTDTPMAADEVKRLADTAHEEGFSVMAHANGDAAVSAAAEAGIESVEHGAYLSEQTLYRLKEAGTVWVPTLSTVANLCGEGRFPDEVVTPLRKRQMDTVRRAAELGVLLAPGSDAGAWAVRHAQGGRDEYRWMRQAIGGGADAVLEKGIEAIRLRF